MQTSQSLSRKERLRNYRLIEKLFTEGSSFFNYPFKVVYIINQQVEGYSNEPPVQCLFSVSKRNFKKAVERNKIKRLMREAYRKNKNPLYETLQKHNRNMVFALIYTGKDVWDYAKSEAKIINIIKRLNQELNRPHAG